MLARGDGRVVVGLRRDAATAAGLEGDGGLGDAEVYGDAKDVLGDGMGPSFLLSMPAVIKLVDAMGETDADFERGAALPRDARLDRLRRRGRRRHASSRGSRSR